MLSRKPLWIALTGGIASGKSAVAAAFSSLGVPIIDTDQLAREVVAPGQPALAAIVARFSSTVLAPDGSLDRRRLRERIFNHPEDKQALEAILHPAIRAAQHARSAELDGAYQLHVVPLLLETGSQSLYDRILVVDCTRQVQLARLLQRDDISQELAERMLNAQASREQRLSIADDVLENNGPATEIAEKAAFLHARYLQLAESTSQRRQH